MDGVRTAEGGEGVTGAMIRARIWVAGRLGGGLQALLGAPMAAYSGCGERDGGIGHGKRRSGLCWREFAGTLGWLVGQWRQAGSGMARSRARARLNWGQRRGRCRVNRRAERVIRPAKAKTRRLGSWWSRSADPGRCGLSSGPGYAPSPPPARRRGGEARRRHVVQPDAVLEVAYGVLDLGVAAMIGLSSVSPSRSVMKP